jgi:hypothetical protein
MPMTVAAVFDNQAAAERAVAAVAATGIEREEISVIWPHPEAAERGGSEPSPVSDDLAPGDVVVTEDAEVSHAASRAAMGGLVGAALGLAAGVATLLIPGFGLVAAGPIASALAGAALGAATGGLAGAFEDMGVSPEHAARYEAHLAAGRLLVSVRAPEDHVDAVRHALHAAGGHDLFVRGLKTPPLI